jgi:hypothetical protein
MDPNKFFVLRVSNLNAQKMNITKNSYIKRFMVKHGYANKNGRITGQEVRQVAKMMQNLLSEPMFTRTNSTNRLFIRLINESGLKEAFRNRNYNKIAKISKSLTNLSKKYYNPNATSFKNFETIRNSIYDRRYRDHTKNVTKIQSAYRGYLSRKDTPVTYLLGALVRDGRFKYESGVLQKLYKLISITIRITNRVPKNNRKTAITNKIGICHINPTNVPRIYLGTMKNQLVLVAKSYYSMTSEQRKVFRDRFKSKIIGPCLENIMEALIDSITEPTFNWYGKTIQPPLGPNNNRYLTNVIEPAVNSWGIYSKGKIPKNLKNRTNMFWSAIKNKNLHVVYVNNKGEQQIAFSTPASYNVNGRRFRSNKNAINGLAGLK